MLDKRTEDIRSELEEAERLKVEAQDLLASYQRKYDDAMKTVDEIMKQSKDVNKRMKAEAKAELKETLKRREDQLLERIERAEKAAIQEVKEKAADILYSRIVPLGNFKKPLEQCYAEIHTGIEEKLIKAITSTENW